MNIVTRPVTLKRAAEKRARAFQREATGNYNYQDWIEIFVEKVQKYLEPKSKQ